MINFAQCIVFFMSFTSVMNGMILIVVLFFSCQVGSIDTSDLSPLVSRIVSISLSSCNANCIYSACSFDLNLPSYESLNVCSAITHRSNNPASVVLASIFLLSYPNLFLKYSMHSEIQKVSSHPSSIQLRFLLQIPFHSFQYLNISEIAALDMPVALNLYLLEYSTDSMNLCI